jgi:hypothetical protein
MSAHDKKTTEDLADYLSKRLKHQELMAILARGFISESVSMAELINNSLCLTGEYLGVERILISSVDTETGVSRVDYLWRETNEVVTKPETTGLAELMASIFPENAPCGLPTRQPCLWEKLIKS